MGGGGVDRRTKTSAGSRRRKLALQCSLKFSARKNYSHVSKGSVVGLGQNAGTPIRSVRSSPTKLLAASCGMSTDRLLVTKVIVIKCELVIKAMLRYLYFSLDNERVIFIQQ